MFSTLESNWDQSARRGRATVASFVVQAFGLSLLLAIPLLTIQGPPKLHWLTSEIFPPPSAPAPPPSGQRVIHSSNISGGQLQTPQTIPDTVAVLDESRVGSAPEIGDAGVDGGFGVGRRGVPGATGIAIEVVPPPPAPTHPIKLSHWAEGNIVYRVQPVYPPIAKQARVQGLVEMRAIISKTGTIENLTVVIGHPMLASAAVDAVRHWRYRPYLLNDEPVEVETEITVNFVLSAN